MVRFWTEEQNRKTAVLETSSNEPLFSEQKNRTALLFFSSWTKKEEPLVSRIQTRAAASFLFLFCCLFQEFKWFVSEQQNSERFLKQTATNHCFLNRRTEQPLFLNEKNRSSSACFKNRSKKRLLVSRKELLVSRIQRTASFLVVRTTALLWAVLETSSRILQRNGAVLLLLVSRTAQRNGAVLLLLVSRIACFKNSKKRSRRKPSFLLFSSTRTAVQNNSFSEAHLTKEQLSLFSFMFLLA